jgi:hypothetical protein
MTAPAHHLTAVEHVPSIYEAIGAVMRDLAPIGKDGRNKEQGYSFRSIDQMYDVIGRACAKHGVFTVPELEELVMDERPTRNGGSQQVARATVTFKFFGPAGDFVVATTVGQGMDSGDKATNKALTAAHKWALTQVFMPPFTGMDDGDQHTPELAPAPKAPRPASKKRLDALTARVKALDETSAQAFTEWKNAHRFKWPYTPAMCDAIEQHLTEMEAAENAVGGSEDLAEAEGRDSLSSEPPTTYTDDDEQRPF